MATESNFVAFASVCAATHELQTERYSVLIQSYQALSLHF